MGGFISKFNIQNVGGGWTNVKKSINKEGGIFKVEGKILKNKTPCLLERWELHQNWWFTPCDLFKIFNQLLLHHAIQMGFKVLVQKKKVKMFAISYFTVQAVKCCENISGHGRKRKIKDPLPGRWRDPILWKQSCLGSILHTT